MSSPVISVRGLGKRYQLGSGQAHDTLRDQLAHGAGEFLRRLTKRHGTNGHQTEHEAFWALRDISFDVQEGEVVGVIGRNGAGKSTLLKVLSEITEPTAGEVRIRGRVASLLEVGTGFHAELTGRENIYLNGAILGMTRAEIQKKFDEIVAFAEIEKFLDMPVKRYSSGMYMRLAFAVAAHLEPEIMIVDEVLAVGDSQFQKKCLGKMGEVARQGRTVLFVSHNLGMIERLTHRCLILASGALNFAGDTSDAVPRYVQDNTAPDIAWCPGVQSERSEPYLTTVYLCNEDGTPCGNPTSAGLFGLQIEYCVPRRIADLILGVSVFNESEQPLFSSTPLDSGSHIPKDVGYYKTRMMFPPGIFMPRRFIVGAALYSGAQLFDRNMSCMSFQVEEVSSLANLVIGGRIGELQVACLWTESETIVMPCQDKP